MREKNILMAAFPKNETGISNKKKQIVIRKDKNVFLLASNKRLQYSHNIIASMAYTNK